MVSRNEHENTFGWKQENKRKEELNIQRKKYQGKKDLRDDSGRQGCREEEENEEEERCLQERPLDRVMENNQNEDNPAKTCEYDPSNDPL